jgi:hypothetical protein
LSSFRIAYLQLRLAATRGCYIRSYHEALEDAAALGGRRLHQASASMADEPDADATGCVVSTKDMTTVA